MKYNYNIIAHKYRLQIVLHFATIVNINDQVLMQVSNNIMFDRSKQF